MTDKINWRELKNLVYRLHDAQTRISGSEIKNLMMALDSAENDELELEELKYKEESMFPIELIDKELTRLHETYRQINVECSEGEFLLRGISEMHGLIGRYVEDELEDGDE